LCREESCTKFEVFICLIFYSGKIRRERERKRERERERERKKDSYIKIEGERQKEIDRQK
jgi:hypothetical protein